MRRPKQSTRFIRFAREMLPDTLDDHSGRSGLAPQQIVAARIERLPALRAELRQHLARPRRVQAADIAGCHTHPHHTIQQACTVPRPRRRDTTDARNNRVVRFILCALERHLAGQALDFGSDAFNVEHVLPQNAPDGWGGFTPDEAQAMAYRLGNMTLLQSGANRDAGNSSYAAKRAIYQQSGYALTRRLAADNAEWSPERIAAWQSWMADQATSIWRIAQLG